MSVTWRPGPMRIDRNFKVNRGSNGLPTSVSVRFFGMWFILWSRNGRRRGLSYVDGPGSLNFQVNGNKKGRKVAARNRVEEAGEVRGGGFVVTALKRIFLIGIIALTFLAVVYDVPGSIATIF